MYLKSLELYGFKSFPDRTKLLFEKGTTIIVGPNGSGKSNISDAMKWVLGEISTKSIRGSKMEDIIFSGTETRKPMGFAEVSVTFDNTDPENRLDCVYDEVTVTRRYYRVGESEYFINRRAVRLRDIYQLFMNTGIGRDGYSIIGQGKIAEIISRKSEERRGIFEDASGIAKFRFQKNEAERNLGQTVDNITRVNDVFVEIENRVGPLEKEAVKAKRAIELMERKKEADIRLWLYDSERLRTAVEAAVAELEKADFDFRNISESLESLQNQSETLLQRSQSNKASSEQLLGRIREQTRLIYTIQSDRNLTDRNIQHTNELINAADESTANYRNMLSGEKELTEGKQRLIKEYNKTLGELNAEYEKLGDEREALDNKVRRLKSECDKAFTDISETEAQLAELRTQLAVLRNASNEGSDKNDSVLREIDEYEKAVKDLETQCEAKEKLLGKYNSNIAAISEKLTGLNEKRSELNALREQNMQALSRLIIARDTVSQKIDTYNSIQKNFDEYISSVRFVMNQYAEGKITDRNGNRCGTIYGPLSKVISVDDEYITAIEVALGANIQNIVVEDAETAKAAIFALKRAEKGRATFFPIDSMKGQSASRETVDAGKFRGYVSAADKLVECEDKFANIISSLLARTVVFDNIDNANYAAKALGYRVKIVTLDGQQVNVGGSFTGGSTGRNNGILSRAAEIRHMQDSLEAYEKEIADARNELDSTDAAIEDINDEISENENNKGLMEAMAGTVLPAVEKLRAQIDANKTLIEKMNSDFRTVKQRRDEYELRITDLSAELAGLENKASEIKAFRNERNIEMNAAEDALGETDAKITELYIKISGMKKDIETESSLLEASKTRASEIQANIQSMAVKKTEYAATVRELTEKLKLSDIAEKEAEELLTKLNSERAEIENEGSEFEKRISEINAGTKELMANKEIAFRARTLTESKLENLKAEQDKIAPMLMDDYGMTRADALKLGYLPIISDEERRSSTAIQTECRNKLRAIGHVDLDAVEKYNELKKRYDEMLVQITDLRESEAKIRAEIKELDKQMEKTFLDAFNKINENFGRVFSELFGGGHAEILLTEPDDVLSSGIEIKAAPPGKIIKSLMQLSGGEQSFVAIALFFATLQVNPTPFCILDEIEAALDDANVSRFANYIKRYSEETQFIIISHRRGTMEAAERLYGVTMPERGISKVLSLVISEIAGKGDKELDGLFG